MAETAVINASPLIFLGRAKHLELLRELFGACLVPEPVLEEIFRRGAGDSTAKALGRCAWLKPVTPPDTPGSVTAWGLGPGESSVLATALSRQDDDVVAVLDDLAGRKCAASHDLPVRGTLGCVLVAKQRGLIPLARPVMETLVVNGMYLSRSVLDQALARVGE
ncbi:MAG: DUF3368 domain-containing protein [Magnetococcales bacterium]|nr:DUF3368 domain-containing protein [Magnetococcales bacterium]